MSYSFRRNLFESANGTPMIFDVKGCGNTEELVELIEFGGGLIHTSEEPGDYVISLADAVDGEGTGAGDRDVFGRDFIIRSCMKNRILPLEKFRLNQDSYFREEFDPSDVLFHNISWREAEEQWRKDKIHNGISEPSRDSNSNAKMNRSEESIEDHSKESDDDLAIHSSSSEDKIRLTKANGPQQRRKRSRCDFTQEERKGIVQFLVKSKRFDEITGTQLWMRMSNTFPRHTWQSLKEHFIKKIFPMLDDYNLSEEILNRISLGMNARQGTKNRRYSGRNPYTAREDKLILDYVKKHKKQDTAIGGNAFWIEMMEKDLVPGRTWQAVRERYLKHLQSSLNKCPSTSTSGSARTNRMRNLKELKNVNSSGKNCISPYLTTQRNGIKRNSHDESSAETVSSDSGNDDNHPIKRKKLALDSNHEAEKHESAKESKKLTSEEQSSSNNGKEIKEYQPKSPCKRRKRMLYDTAKEFVTPSKTEEVHTPVSVKIQGPSILDFQVNKTAADWKRYRKRFIKIAKDHPQKSPTQTESSLPENLNSSNMATNLDGKLIPSSRDAPCSEKPCSTSRNSSICGEDQCNIASNQTDVSHLSQTRKGENSLAGSDSDDDGDLNEIALPEWPANFTAEEIVYVDTVSGEKTGVQDTYSDSDCSLPNTESEDSWDEVVGWSNDELSYRGALIPKPPLRLKRKRNECTKSPNSVQDVSKPVIALDDKENEPTSLPPSPVCSKNKVTSLGSNRVPNLQKSNGRVSAEGANETFDFLGDFTLPDEEAQSKLLASCNNNAGGEHVQGSPHKSTTENTKEDVCDVSGDSFDFNRESFNFTSDDCQSFARESNTELVDAFAQTETGVDACTQTEPIEVLPFSPYEDTSALSLSLEKDSFSLEKSSESTSLSASPCRSPVSADRCTRFNAEEAKRQTRSISRPRGSVGVPSPKFQHATISTRQLNNQHTK